jgi:hypothetical protein
MRRRELIALFGVGLIAPPAAVAAQLRPEAHVILWVLTEAEPDSFIAGFPRTTVDWDTSQADDFRRRGEPWTIKRTRLKHGRARRSGRKGVVQQHSGAAAGCHASSRVRRCCGCCGEKIWRPSRVNWRHGGGADRLA